MSKGETINLYDQDYTDIVAFATSPAAEMFFGAVLSGTIPQMLYSAESELVYIGRIKAETGEEIHLEEVVSVAPGQLLRVHDVSNYSPIDCMRALWFETKTLRPDLLDTAIIDKAIVRQRMSLTV